MRTSEITKDIFAAYVTAQADLKNATFDKVNPHFKSKYVTLAGMRDMITPILAKHGLAIIQGADTDADGMAITTRLVHTSGQWIESRYPFTIDKPQQMGSAMTYARRYCMGAICGIASEDDDDGNAAQETAPAKSNVTPMPKAQARPEYTKISSGVREIKSTGTLDDLNAWYKSHRTTIEAMDLDWGNKLLEEFADAKAAINAKAA